MLCVGRLARISKTLIMTIPISELLASLTCPCRISFRPPQVSTLLALCGHALKGFPVNNHDPLSVILTLTDRMLRLLHPARARAEKGGAGPGPGPGGSSGRWRFSKSSPLRWASRARHFMVVAK